MTSLQNPRHPESLPTQVQERNKRVNRHCAIVRPIALHYAHRCRESADDLLQVGLMGLIRAAELYSEARSIPFEAFARHHIRGAILHYLRDAAPTVRLPRSQQELADRIRTVSRSLREVLGREPSDEELRAALQLSKTQWQRYQQLLPLSRLVALESDPQLEQEADRIRLEEGAIEWETNRDALQLMAQLEPRQRRVVGLVVLAGQSLRQTGKELNVSPMTVHRLLRRGLETIRNGLQQTAPPSRGQSALPVC